jgi:hypothetical protein
MDFEQHRSLGKKLDITDEQTAEVRLLAEEDENLRQKRAKVIFPEDFEHFIIHLNKQVS